jgi:predicted alpha/beta hydrolase family esterase
MSAKKATAATQILTVPGLHGSGPGHWQSWLETQCDAAARVEQAAWDTPDLHAWTGALHDTLEAHQPHPVVLVAHSFGCLAAARALCDAPAQVAAVLYVAPACPARFGLHNDSLGGRLAIPSILVASENDPWMPLQGAIQLADQWGSTFINLGASGHINVASGYGPWPLAARLVESLIERSRGPYRRTSRAGAATLHAARA